MTRRAITPADTRAALASGVVFRDLDWKPLSELPLEVCDLSRGSRRVDVIVMRYPALLQKQSNWKNELGKLQWVTWRCA